jgi:hypothetical protein
LKRVPVLAIGRKLANISIHSDDRTPSAARWVGIWLGNKEVIN